MQGHRSTKVIWHHAVAQRDLVAFKREPDVMVANRIANDIRDLADKVSSRDLAGSD